MTRRIYRNPRLAQAANKLLVAPTPSLLVRITRKFGRAFRRALALLSL